MELWTEDPENKRLIPKSLRSAKNCLNICIWEIEKGDIRKEISK